MKGEAAAKAAKLQQKYMNEHPEIQFTAEDRAQVDYLKEQSKKQTSLKDIGKAYKTVAPVLVGALAGGPGGALAAAAGATAKFEADKQKEFVKTAPKILVDNQILNPSNDVSWSGILQGAANVFNGLNQSQAKPSTTKPGGVAVPQSQAGSGIFSGLVNLGAALLTKPANVQTPVATSVASAGYFPASGGVSVTGTGSIGNPVTTNTTNSQSSSTGSIPGWVWVLGGVVVVFLLIGKKLFR